MEVSETQCDAGIVERSRTFLNAERRLQDFVVAKGKHHIKFRTIV
jgi:hypothetical protein